MIQTSVIEEIKYRNDIVDVISASVKLKKAGSNYSGLCPFHSEKTPSFVVFPATRNFYCFGCGAGGDVITYVMKEENLTYPEALESLARRVGIEIQTENRAEEKTVKKSRLLDMNREAARFFHQCLLNEAQYPEGMNYLRKRGLSTPLIRHFGIGYAPNDRFLLTNYLREKGYTAEELCAGFLSGTKISPKKNQPYSYDYFRGRIMFPIIDLTGNIVAFGGRIVNGDGTEPKYLNSSDTPAFKKRRQLFALNFAKDYCSEQLILCEGYMDVIALHGAGFQNAVATLGTAMTSEHARLMKRYTKSVVISYDSDEAGQRAADKAFRLLSEVGLDTRVLKVEGAKDPDEYIKKFGADGFRKFLSGSKTQFEFKLEGILSKYDSSKMDEKIKAADEATSLIASFSSDVERELYGKAVSETLELPLESVRSDVKRKRRKSERLQTSEEMQKIVSSSGGYGDRINPDFVKNPAAAAAEEAILGMLFLKPELISLAKGTYFLTEEDFLTSFNRRVYSAVLKNLQEDGSFEEALLSDEFTAEEMGRIIQMKVRRLTLTENSESLLSECIEKLRNSKRPGEKISDIQNILGNKRRREK